MRRPVPVLLVLLLAAAAACSSDDGDTTPTTTTADTTTTILSIDPDVVEDGLVFPPGVINPLGPYDPVIFGLTVGACFDFLTVTVGQQITQYVTGPPCDGEHEYEMYYTVDHPAGPDDPYPGEDELRSYALEQCYRQFEPFVGQIYELSTLEIGYSIPPRANWEDPVGRFRRISCWLGDDDGGTLVGTARNSQR